MLENTRVALRIQVYLPHNKSNEFFDFIDMINEENEGTFSKNTKIPSELLTYYNQLKKIESLTGIQMKLPYEIRIR